MQDIIDADYTPICKDIEIKRLQKYHDLYDQSNMLWLADVFENFRNTCVEIYELDPKNIRLNSTHYFIMKIPNKRRLQQITFNHPSDIDFKEFMNLYKNYTPKPYSFLVIDATIDANSLRFRKNLVGRI